MSGNGWDNLAHAKDYTPTPKYYGRFNLGVCSVNLPYIALLSGGNKDKFWKLLDKYTEMCHTVNRIRAERLSKTEAGVAPILWCDGALARLDPHDTLDSLIHNGYATASLGYAGVYETVKYITGEDHYKEGEGKEFGLKIMKFLNAQCDKWKAEENIGYSLYGTPLENTTGTFAKALQRDFPTVKGINDREYVTNSYHVPVFAHINAFNKLAIESEYQALSLGGSISYAETANLQNNIEAVEEIMQFIYGHIMYAELNTKSDYCQVCGYSGEIELKYDENTHSHYYECPNCGNKDFDKMNIARRVCGYISTTLPSEGRLSDIADRYVHLDDHEVGDTEQ